MLVYVTVVHHVPFAVDDMMHQFTNCHDNSVVIISLLHLAEVCVVMVAGIHWC